MSESTQHGPVEILLVGVNHLTSDVALRDRLLIDADKARTLSHDLTRSGHAREKSLPWLRPVKRVPQKS